VHRDFLITLYKNNSRLDTLLSDTISIKWALVSFVLLVLLSTHHHMSRRRVDDAGDGVRMWRVTTDTDRPGSDKRQGAVQPEAYQVTNMPSL
jgi:hypothetical protein